jgi:hypothetical protein
MDLENPVLKMCVEGMRAEGEGRGVDAAEAFGRAWDTATDDYERFIAAHYVARCQAVPEDALTWNARCLSLADAVGDQRVAGFYPSLHLDVGQACEDLGRLAEAREHYAAAERGFGALPDSEYGATVRAAVIRGLLRVGARLEGP